MSERRAIVVFTEGDFEEACTRPTLVEARAFAEGVEAGASFYGAGSCSAYVLPDDAETLWADAKNHDCSIDAASLNNALVAAAEALEKARLADAHD